MLLKSILRVYTNSEKHFWDGGGGGAGETCQFISMEYVHPLGESLNETRVLTNTLTSPKVYVLEDFENASPDFCTFLANRIYD